MKLTAVFLLFFSIQLTVSAKQTEKENTRLNLNDVSVLLPLPAANDLNLLPQPETETNSGQLLPKNYVTKYMPMLLQLTENADLYPSFRAVGFRIDPCFTEGAGPVKCKQQIRIVWQPLKVDGNKTTTVDVTLHSFYELDSLKFKQLVSELRELKKSTSADVLPLQINPTLKREGLQSNYYKNLMGIIYQYVGEQNLSRITFMSLFANETVWFFGGININQEKQVSKIIIPRINNGIQQFINTAEPANTPESFLGRIFPAPAKEEDNFNALLADSSKFTSRNEQEIIAFTRAAYKFENPALNNPGTLDCVSCHAAQPVRSWTSKNFPNTDWGDLKEIAYSPERNTQNLNNHSPMQNQTNILRAFGYFKDQGFVSQRVINESNEVVNALEASY